MSLLQIYYRVRQWSYLREFCVLFLWLTVYLFLDMCSHYYLVTGTFCFTVLFCCFISLNTKCCRRLIMLFLLTGYSPCCDAERWNGWLTLSINVSLCSWSFTLPEFVEDLNQLLYVADVRCRSREAKDVWLERFQPGPVRFGRRTRSQKFVFTLVYCLHSVSLRTQYTNSSYSRSTNCFKICAVSHTLNFRSSLHLFACTVKRYYGNYIPQWILWEPLSNI